jgi:hypothetical protein
MRPLVAALLLVTLAPAAPVPKAVKKKDDKELLVGTWKPVNQDSAWFQFAADGTLKTWHGETDNPNSQMNWSWALDPEPTPRRVRLTRVPDSHNGYDCLYELDGDTLKFVFLLKKGMDPPKKVEGGPDLQFHQMTKAPPAK